MSDEITESAKAAQEIAKTTRVGIEATEKLGGFVSRLINEPLESVVGVLTDRLQFMRAERQLRLVDRWREIIKGRRIDGALRVVSPKLALPIIEAASLEEDDELQDLWANLLASAVDPNFKGTTRSAFIDIIKQLEVIDVHVLNTIFYVSYKPWGKDYQLHVAKTRSPLSYPVYSRDVVNELGIELRVYETSLDNLFRVRCLSSYVEPKHIVEHDDFHSAYNPRSTPVTFDHRYDAVCLTSLGVDFIEACTPRAKEDGLRE